MKAPMSKEDKRITFYEGNKPQGEQSSSQTLLLMSREAYQMKGEELVKGCLAYKNPHLLQQQVSK
jgi:hypothetical protein